MMEVNLDSVETESRKAIKVASEKKSELSKINQKLLEDIHKIRMKNDENSQIFGELL